VSEKRFFLIIIYRCHLLPPPTKKPDPQHFLKTGDGLKKGNYYNRYALYRENAK
jgi:hypothetical protein